MKWCLLLLLTAVAAEEAAVGPCQKYMLEGLSDWCFARASSAPTCAGFRVQDCEEQWAGLHKLIETGACDAEGSQLSSKLLTAKVKGRGLFKVIYDLARRFGACQVPQAETDIPI